MPTDQEIPDRPLPAPTAISIVPSRSELATLTEIANAMIAARIPLPPGCNTPQALLIKFLFGRELGLPPMVSLYEIDLIEGRGAMNARTQVGMIRRRKLGDVRLLRQTDTEAAVEAWRADDPDNRFEFIFTMEDAQRADLAGRRTWKKYPKSMLLARATSLATHALFQEVFLGVACTPEELGADDLDENGRLEFIDTVATSGVQRKTTTELTTREAARIAESKPVQTATPVEPDPDREYVATAIKTMVTTILKLSPDNWAKVRKPWAHTDGTKMTFDELVELHGHLESLVLLTWMREALKIPDDKWQHALERRGALALYDLNPNEAAKFEEKLTSNFSPFEAAKLRTRLFEQLGRPKASPARTTAGNGSPPAKPAS